MLIRRILLIVVGVLGVMTMALWRENRQMEARIEVLEATMVNTARLLQIEEERLRLERQRFWFR